MKELIKHAKARYRNRVIRALMSVTGKSPDISRSLYNAGFDHMAKYQ